MSIYAIRKWTLLILYKNTRREKAHIYWMDSMITTHSSPGKRTHRTTYPCNELQGRMPQHNNSVSYIYTNERVTVKPILAHVVVTVEIKCGRPRENLHQTPQVASATSGRLTQSLKIEKEATSLGSRLTYHGLREQYTIEAARKGLHAFSPSQHVDGYEQLTDSPCPRKKLFSAFGGCSSKRGRRSSTITLDQRKRTKTRSLPDHSYNLLLTSASVRSHIRLPAGTAPWPMNFLESLGSNVAVLLFQRWKP